MMIVMMLEILMIEMVNDDDDSDAGYDKEKDSE